MEQNSKTDNGKIVIKQVIRRTNGLGTAGFIMALIALIFSWVPGVGWLVWFLGFLFSFIGLFKRPRGLAIAGFLISIIDLIVLIAIIGGIGLGLGLLMG